MALFEHGVCLGDSLTTGARSRFGLAEGLSSMLHKRTGKSWMFRCEAVNGETVLQLLRRMDQKPHMWDNVAFATLIIGTNDSKSMIATPPETYRMLYEQVLDRIQLVKGVWVFPGLIPQIWVTDALASPYDHRCNDRIVQYNQIIRQVADERKLKLVDTRTHFELEDYSDGVHFSEAGIWKLSDRFGEAICKRGHPEVYQKTEGCSLPLPSMSARKVAAKKAKPKR